ncbi:MAG: cupin domain-containing protein [Halioglobus sp.]
MTITIVKPTKEEMIKCIARAGDIEPKNDGFIDSGLPGCDRWMYDYLRFNDPSVPHPVGDTSTPAISHLKPGFGLGFVKAAPGNGVPMHAHDTNETFMVLSGTWKLEWEGADGTDHAILGKHDALSVPVGVMRRFEAVETDPQEELCTMLAVIAGDAPDAKFSPEAVQFFIDNGRITAEQVAAIQRGEVESRQGV